MAASSAMLTVGLIALLVATAIAVGVAAWRVAGWADVRGPDAAAPRDPGAAADRPDAPPGTDPRPVVRPTAPALILAPRPAVVLVHGLLGFDALGVGRARIPYFRGIAPRLEAAGHPTIVARLPMIGCVPTRAQALADAIAALPHDRVVLVAHSMGGLDARWALARLGIADRVGALVTLGSPHRGSPLADLLAAWPARAARAAAARLGLATDALDWLTTTRWAALNRELTDVAGVRYASIVGAITDRGQVHPLLRVPHAYLAWRGEASDGLVPRSSQAWGDDVTELPLDHFAQVGWTGDGAAADAIADAVARVTAVRRRGDRLATAA